MRIYEQNAAKTHCLHGHPLSGDNVYLQPRKGRSPSRQCRECRRRAQLRFVERRRTGSVRCNGLRPWVRRRALLGLLDAGYSIAQLARWARTEPEVIQARIGGGDAPVVR